MVGEGERAQRRDIESKRKVLEALVEMDLLEDVMNAKDAKKAKRLLRRTDSFSELFASVAIFYLKSERALRSLRLKNLSPRGEPVGKWSSLIQNPGREFCRDEEIPFVEVEYGNSLAALPPDRT